MKWEVGFLLSVAVAASIGAQGPTIPELAARATEPVVTLNRNRDVVTLELAELLGRSDLVVRGTIVPLRSYLSDDQLAIYTDYLVSPVRLIVMRHARHDKPTLGLNEIAFSHFGGTMTFHGVTVQVIDRNLPPFKKNTEVIVLLQRSGNETKASAPFKIVGSLAAFEIRRGGVHPMMEPTHELGQYRGMPEPEFISRVIALYKR